MNLCLKCRRASERGLWCQTCVFRARQRSTRLERLPWWEWPVYAGVDVKAYCEALAEFFGL